MDVVSYSLPGLGALVEIKNAHELKVEEELPTIVVVMDMSGSMGSLGGIVLSDCLPNAMQLAGYDIANTRVKIITFASESGILLIDGQYPTGAQLQNTYYQGGGHTKMAGVFELLEPELKRFKNIALFGISDGEIQDVTETLRIAEKASHHCSAHVEVTMVRLITSPSSNPDTRALACLGQFGTNGLHSIDNINATSVANDALWRSEMTALIRSHLLPRRLLTVAHINLRRTPSEEPSLALYLSHSLGNPDVFLAPCGITVIGIQGQIYNVREVTEPSPRAMQFFCDYASTKLQLCNILGFNVDVMKLWFTKFAALLDQESQFPIADVKLRMRQFQRRMTSGLRGAINEVLHNANQERLRSLNQQQAADYLRQSTSKALAKRACKNAIQQDNRGDKNTLCQQVTTMVRNFESFQTTNTETECSFFSVYNNYDAFACFAQENKGVELDENDDLELLRVVGLLGVCYNHTPADFVDPYTFRVADVFGGSYLNMADLREANSQKIAGVTAELKAPGTNAIITGVVPLRFLNPALFDFFWQHGMKLLEAHCSLNMRRMLAPVRADMLGERIGVMMHLMRKCSLQGNNKMSAWDQMVFEDLLEQLKMLLAIAPHKKEFERLAAHVTQKQNFRNLLTGADNVSCMQKPFIALLCYTSPEDALYITDMLEVLFEFEAYHRARHHFSDSDARDQAMTRVLNIDTSKIVEWFPMKEVEYIPTELEGVYRTDLVHAKVERLMQVNTAWRVNEMKVLQNDLDVAWMPSRALYATFFDVMVHRNLQEPGASNAISQEKLLSVCSHEEPKYSPEQAEVRPLATMFDREVGRISSRRFFVSLVAAIHARSEQDRIVEGKNQLFEWATTDAESNFVQRIAHDMYASVCETQITLEMVRRDNAHLMTQIYLMVRPDMDANEFRTNLQLEIPNREHPGYKLLMAELLQHSDVSFFTEKLAILIAGRTFENNVCFAQGNFDRDFFKYERFFNEREWQTLVDFKREFGVWVYRNSDIPNRQGHCNSNPSDWAVNIYPNARTK